MDVNIRGRFKELPTALQEQVLIRSGTGIVLGIVSLGIILYTRNWILGIPSLILTFFMIVNSLYLLYNCIRKRYVVVKGRCTEVERTGARKRVKSLRMKTADKTLTIMVPVKIKVPAVEDMVTVYLPENMPVYEVDGGYCIYRFYAFELERKV